MSTTVSIGIANTPAAVVETTIECRIKQTGDTIQGNNNDVLAKSNAFSPLATATVVSNGANQDTTFPTGATGVLVKPPVGNSVLTSLVFGPNAVTYNINPLCHSDITFDPLFLPATVRVNASPANLPIQLIFY
jgi:hypothetical protein